MRYRDLRPWTRRQSGLIVPAEPRRGHVCLPMPSPVGNVAARNAVEGGGVWTPLQLASKIFWIDATLSVKWQDTARTVVASADADVVAVPDDLFGLNNPTVTADANRAILKKGIITGQDVLRYDGVNDYHTWGDLAAADFGTGPFSIAMVLQTPDSTNSILLKDSWASGANNGIFIYGGGGKFAWWDGVGDNLWGTANASFHLLIVVRRGTGANQVELYADNAAAVLTTDGRTFSNAQNLAFAADNGGSKPRAIDLGSALMTGAAWDTETILKLKAYFKSRFTSLW